MLWTFLRIVFGAAKVEKRYRCIAWTTDFRRMSLNGVFSVLNVQEESLFSREAKRSFH